MRKNKKNYKFLILATLLTVGCTSVTPNVTTPTVIPTAIPTSSATPIAVITPLPVITPIAVVTPLPVITPIATITPNPVTTTENFGKLHIKNGYLKTPSSAYLASIPFEMNFKLSFDEIPAQNKKITIFELFDENSSDKKVHYSLSLYTDNDNKSQLILFAQSETQSITKNIPLDSIEINKEYDFTFLRDEKTVSLNLDNKSLISSAFVEDDFVDLMGRRTLVFGSDRKGDYKSKLLVDYIKIKDTIDYEFNNNLQDSYKRKLDASFIGDYEYPVNPLATPTPVVSPTASPTPTASATAVPERDVSSTNGTATLWLGLKTDSEMGQYTSESLDFASKKIGNVGIDGDVKFVTQMDEFNGNKIQLAGTNLTPAIYVIDLGMKNFDGVKDISDLDFNGKQLFSESNILTDVIQDHVYAIKTYRYGEKPRYAKLVIKYIYTLDYEKEDIKKPEITKNAQFVDSGISENTNFSDNVDYQYYVSAYDGDGETIPEALQSIFTTTNAADDKATFSFVIPHGATGYTVYKEFSGDIVKIGPYLAEQDSTVNFEDFGKNGYKIQELPNKLTTKKSGFLGKDILDKIEFKYQFNGDGKTTFE